MPYPSLFNKMDIKTVKLADKVRCATSDKQFLVYIDDERKKAVQAVESKSSDYAAALKQIDAYLAVQASYLAFARSLNEKQDKSLFEQYFPSEFEYIHYSPLTQVKICTKPAMIDRYLFNLYYVLISMDSLLFDLNKQTIQNALTRVDLMRELAPNITIEGEEFLDFKTELLDIFEHLFQGLLLLLGAVNAEAANVEAGQNPPYSLKYTYNQVAGIYTYALQEFELIQTQIVYHDPKNKRLQLPREFQNFISKLKCVAALCMLVCMVLEFEVNPFSYGTPQEQSTFCRTRIAQVLAEYKQCNSQFDVFNAFFTRNFGQRIQEAEQYYYPGPEGNISKFPIQGVIKRAEPFVDFQPTWTTLKPAK